MTTRRRPSLAVAATVVAGALIAGCLSRRDRLDVPRITLIVDDSIVAAGGTVSGRTRVTDESGIIFVSVTVFTPDSGARVQLNRVAADSIELEFSLGVVSTAPPDAPVSVRVVARDNQDFEVTVTDTVYVRASPPAA